MPGWCRGRRAEKKARINSTAAAIRLSWRSHRGGGEARAAASRGFIWADQSTMKQFDLEGRVAIVTGGNGGIGFAMAKSLAEAGASIVVAGRNTAKSDQAVAVLADLGAKAMAIAIDVTDEAACKAMVEAAVARFGRADILINNAGTNIRKRPEAFTLAEWHMILDANLTSAFTCSQAAYPALKQSGGGKIINIGSMMSVFGTSFGAAYSAAKGGIVQLTKSLAVAWAADRIQVNAVLPGWIDTDLSRGARVDIPDLHDRVQARTPAGRWGVPEDLGGIAVFLASAASDFVTGTAIPVDGGYVAQG
jgi:2-deoxy-D-gluconate 3-dehydrogenase